MARGAEPDDVALRDHLRAVHQEYAGFTENCATNCRDEAGRTSYEWLAEAVDRDRHQILLDIACGSGPLLQLCHETMPADLRLIGIDMSPDELTLARERLPESRATLVEGEAQRLDCLPDNSVDIALCHWALTLMDPVTEVLTELARVISPGGRFAALVDGPMDAAPRYQAVHDLIYGYVQAEMPNYGAIELGDPRVRTGESLVTLIERVLPGAMARIETNVVRMSAPSKTLAKAASGFFYAAFVLSPTAREQMLSDLAGLLDDMPAGQTPTFEMPVNRLIVEFPAYEPC
ncbi:MAG: class I SAM-dependent methyltransferase [Ectothiorhodospiraceae bacterium]